MAPQKSRKEQPKEDPFIHDDDEEEDEDADLEADGPPSIDPYAVLGLEREATADDVKKAYRKMALKHHPGRQHSNPSKRALTTTDKAPADGKEAANKAFQDIAFAYAVLSDDRRRKRYDFTGSTAETLEDDDEFDWLKFYRQQFENVVNQENIDMISSSYKGSSDERRDLLDAYTKYKGRLDAIYQTVLLSDVLEDDDRFRRILDEEIAKGTIDSYGAYERENTDAARKKVKDAEKKKRTDFDKRAKKQTKEEEADETSGKPKPKSKKKDAGGMGDLAALIAQRQQSRQGNFFDHLEAKYAPKGRGGKRASPMDEPPEEMFEAMGARKKQKTKSRAKKAKADVDADLEEEDI